MRMDAGRLVMICGVCVFTAVICRLFDRTSPEYGVFIKIAAAVGITAVIAAAAVPVIGRITDLYASAGSSAGDYLTVLIRCLGISFITKLTADICRDSGESAMATQAETAGRILLLIMALPLYEQAAELCTSLIRV